MEGVDPTLLSLFLVKYLVEGVFTFVTWLGWERNPVSVYSPKIH